jgi:SAM-dependent methyltransferase
VDMFGERVERAVRLPRLARYVTRLAAQCDPGAAVLDLGCGGRSPLPRLLPGLRVIGVDSDGDAVAEAKEHGDHADVICADLTDTPAIAAVTGRHRVQMVCLVHVIEHLERSDGVGLLRTIETLTSRFVVVETPNRFQPQGPEYGSEGQRHRSGWFPHDFETRGYTVRGTAGTRYLRGYAGAPRLRVRGGQSLDFLLARMLMIERFPQHSYALAAFKDVRGVRARLG